MKRTWIALAVCVGLLSLLGTLVLDSTAVAQTVPRRLNSHVGWLALSLALAVALALTPYSALVEWRLPERLRWRGFAHLRLPSLLLGLAVLQLVLVLIPGLSEVRNGARRWPIWGGQPSEFAKLALIFALADYLARNQTRLADRHYGFVRPAAMVGVVAGLIFAEPDWGGATVIAAVGLALMSLAGTRTFYLVSAVIIASLLGVHLLLSNPHRLGRVLSFIDLEGHQHGAGFQQWRSMLAIASGGPGGRFIGDGRFKAGYVPAQETDFVFSVLGEELGFAGCLLVLALYATVVVCGLRVAMRTADPFGRLLASGVTTLIGLQALINVAVATGSLPNKGLPLPFVSYGGSNLMALFAGVGLLVSVARHGPFEPEPDPLPKRRAVGRFWGLRGSANAVAIRHAYQLPPKPAPGAAVPRRARVGTRAPGYPCGGAWPQVSST